MRLDTKAHPSAARQEPPREVKLPGIVAVPAIGEVRVDGQICLERGILEYLAVATHGKEYESLFSLTCQPSHLQTALLLAGFEPGALPPDLRGDESPGSQPAMTRPAGTTLGIRPSRPYQDQAEGEPTLASIQVDVQQPDGSWQRRSIESFLVDRRTGQPPASLVWAFTGSIMVRYPDADRESFVADSERSVIAMWYDATALLNLAQNVGNPYRGNAVGLQVVAGKVPQRGTPIRLVLHRIPAPGHRKG